MSTRCKIQVIPLILKILLITLSLISLILIGSAYIRSNYVAFGTKCPDQVHLDKMFGPSIGHDLAKDKSFCKKVYFTSSRAYCRARKIHSCPDFLLLDIALGFALVSTVTVTLTCIEDCVRKRPSKKCTFIVLAVCGMFMLAASGCIVGFLVKVDESTFPCTKQNYFCRSPCLPPDVQIYRDYPNLYSNSKDTFKEKAKRFRDNYNWNVKYYKKSYNFEMPSENSKKTCWRLKNWVYEVAQFELGTGFLIATGILCPAVGMLLAYLRSRQMRKKMNEYR